MKFRIPAGHSATSGAIAAVLTRYNEGDSANLLVTSEFQFNRTYTPRNFTSFSEIVEEIGISRVYGELTRAAVAKAIC